MDVAVWLRSLGLEKYEAAFRENEINERVLPSLTLEVRGAGQGASPRRSCAPGRGSVTAIITAPAGVRRRK